MYCGKLVVVIMSLLLDDHVYVMGYINNINLGISLGISNILNNRACNIVLLVCVCLNYAKCTCYFY